MSKAKRMPVDVGQNHKRPWAAFGAHGYKGSRSCDVGVLRTIDEIGDEVLLSS